MNFLKIDALSGEHPQFTNTQIRNFLYTHLEEYGDEKFEIDLCLEYVYNKGGFITIAYEGDTIKGIVVMNETGMKAYIPENILVYIAVDATYRGQGVGKQLMQQSIDWAKGNIALHVEPENPARFLYEKLGFTSKYVEMRLNKA